MGRNLSTFTVCLVALGAGPLAARDCTFPGNPVPNCGFDSDLSGGWTFTSGDPVIHVPDDGDSAPGCAQIDRHDAINALEAFTACFPVAPATAYLAGGSARLFSGAIDSGCNLALWEFSDPGCGTFVAGPEGTVTVASSWQSFELVRTTAASTQAVKLRLACFSGLDFAVRIDDFWLTPRLFADGFDSGDTSAWSSVVP